MTDDEIIKALGCCTRGPCSSCPLFSKFAGFCVTELKQKALDLIMRQKAEIERIKEGSK